MLFGRLRKVDPEKLPALVEESLKDVRVARLDDG